MIGRNARSERKAQYGRKAFYLPTMYSEYCPLFPFRGNAPVGTIFPGSDLYGGIAVAVIPYGPFIMMPLPGGAMVCTGIGLPFMEELRPGGALRPGGGPLAVAKGWPGRTVPIKPLAPAMFI